MSPDCEAFAREFFTFFGADWHSSAPGRACVTLPSTLADHFGRAELILVFGQDASAGEDLVAPGSRVFEGMVAYLSGRGRCAQFALAGREWPAPAWSAKDGALVELTPEESDRFFWLYDFSLVFDSDERVERLFRVALDEEGRNAPDAWDALETKTLLFQDTVAPPIPPGQRLAEAEYFARLEAERCVPSFERLAHGRLGQTVTRLEAYFRELIEEVPVRVRRGQSYEDALNLASQEQRRLQDELAKRLGEEARRHHLRITVRPLGYATLRVPGRLWRWRLSVRARTRELQAWQSLATGEVEGARCQRCDKEASEWTACRHLHLICGNCSAQCVACHDVLCERELAACFVCGQAFCGECLLQCVNGHPVCREHRVNCACCGQNVCTGCGVMVVNSTGREQWRIAGHTAMGSGNG